MLKVGDLVKIREDLSYDMAKADIGITTSMLEYKGKIGTVVDIDDDKDFKLDVDNEDWWWHEDWLEKLNKFSIGDKVIVCYEEPVGANETLPYKLLELCAIAHNISMPSAYNGKIGIVVGLKENGVNLDFVGEEKPIWMPNDWLKEYAHKFEKGDKVRIMRSGEVLTNCAGGWYSHMEKYIGDVVTIGERSYNYDNGIVGYIVEENGCIWDGRLLELVEEKEKVAEPEYFTGKVVCINDNYRGGITKGKIYNFVDGKALDDDKDKFPCDDPIHSVDELNDYYKDCCGEDSPQFVEIVE